MNSRPKAARRLTACIVAIVTVTALLPAPASAQSSSPVTVERYAGPDRYGTSVAIASEVSEDFDDMTRVTIASGTAWTDSVVAASVVDWAPVMVSSRSGLPAAALRLLSQKGVEEAMIVSAAPNGRPTVGSAVDRQLNQAGIATRRITGPDQYATAIAAADVFSWDPPSGELAGFGRTVILASGEVFADALVAGPLSSYADMPILLTPKSHLHSSVRKWLSDKNVQHVIIMGGRAALSSAVQTSVESLGAKVTRISGRDRYDTAVKFANFIRDNVPGCFTGQQIGLARGDVPFDAFSAAPLLRHRCAPLLLTATDRIPSSTIGYLDKARSRHTSGVTLHVMGGDAAVSQKSLDSYLGPNQAKSYKNRSPNSVLPATDEFFIDHDAVKELFPQCPRLSDPLDQWHPVTLEVMDENLGRLSGFDTVITAGSDKSAASNFLFATGWFTDESLQYYYGKEYPNLTVSKARKSIRAMPSNHGFLFSTRASDVSAHDKGPRYNGHITHPNSLFAGLSQRLQYHDKSFWDPSSSVYEGLTHYHMGHYGFSQYQLPGAYGTDALSSADQRAYRIPPSVAVHGGSALLKGYTSYMTQYPPLYREPGAWGLHTLLTHVDAACVYKKMYEMCDRPITAGMSPHLRHDGKGSQLGVVLRNLVCAQSRYAYGAYDRLSGVGALYGAPGGPGDPRN